MRRFFINAPITGNMVISGADARHISCVLRLNTGDILLVSGHDGQSGRAEITKAKPEEVQLRLLELVDDRTEPSIAVWLVQGLAKGEKMDFIVQKAVELGIHGIIPAALEHCVVRYDRV